MFYWLAILTTFATGTAVGDLIAEKFSLGYLTTLGFFIVIIAVIAALWKSTPINLGTTTTSYLFLGTIVALVIYLQIRKPDVTPVELVNADAMHHPHLPHPHHEASGDLEPSES
jgi:uncharacterized membrane-anchored protein